MIFEPKTVPLKDGRTCLLRPVRAEDATAMIDDLRTVAAETPFLLRYEDEITFKYYQFIDAASQQEFDSNMRAMAEMSLYDTGVEAVFGDRLLTLSTCDYEETNGRFVVVAKRIE